MAGDGAIEKSESAYISDGMRADGQKLQKNAILKVRTKPFRTKWGSMVGNWGKIAILGCVCEGIYV